MVRNLKHCWAWQRVLQTSFQLSTYALLMNSMRRYMSNTLTSRLTNDDRAYSFASYVCMRACVCASHLLLPFNWVELRFQFLSVYFSLSQHNSKWMNSFVRLFSLSHYLHVNKLGLSILFAVMVSLSVVLYGFVLFLVSLTESYFSFKKGFFLYGKRNFFWGNKFFEEKNVEKKEFSNLELSTDWIDWKWKIIFANRYSLMVHIKFVCIIIHDHLMLRQIFHPNRKTKSWKLP